MWRSISLLECPSPPRFALRLSLQLARTPPPTFLWKRDNGAEISVVSSLASLQLHAYHHFCLRQVDVAEASEACRSNTCRHVGVWEGLSWYVLLCMSFWGMSTAYWYSYISATISSLSKAVHLIDVSVFISRHLHEQNVVCIKKSLTCSLTWQVLCSAALFNPWHSLAKEVLRKGWQSYATRRARWICLFRDFMFVSLTLQSECLNKAWNNLEENVSCSEKDTLCLAAYASNHTFFLFSNCVGRAISVKTQLARFPFELAVRQVKNRQTHFAKRKPFDPFWKQTPRTPFLIWLHGFSTRLWIYCKEKYQITSVNY